MADLAGPELPRSSAAVAEPTIHDPDARGHFGVYGGRFVPEALMAVIEEVTAAYEKARGDQTFLDELDRLQRHYTGRPSPLYEATRLSRSCGGSAALPEARRPQPHRISQDQQCARSGAAGTADGQVAGDRGDGRGAARGGHCHGLCTAGSGVRRLHGRGRHRTSGPQRRADAAAWRGGGFGRVRLQDAEGRDQRGLPGLGHQRRRHVLLLRHRGWARIRFRRWCAISSG